MPMPCDHCNYVCFLASTTLVQWFKNDDGDCRIIDTSTSCNDDATLSPLILLGVYTQAKSPARFGRADLGPPSFASGFYLLLAQCPCGF